MLPILTEADDTELIPLSQLLREGFSPELIARETHITLNPRALDRTLIPPEAFTKLREHLRTLN